MAVKSIALIAAMPEEIKPLIKKLGSIPAKTVGGFRTYRFNRGGRDIFLIESGIGAEKAEEATKTAIEMAHPGIILNFGFGGTPLPGPAVGDIVIAERLMSLRAGNLAEQQGLISEFTQALAVTLRQQCRSESFHIHCGTFVTTTEIIEKQHLAGILPVDARNPVLEMETSAVAKAASAVKVPLAALRGISDGADEHLDFSITDIADRELRIRLWKVLWVLAKKPRLLPQLIRLGKNSSLAADNLAVAVIAFIDRLAIPPGPPARPCHSLAAADQG